MSFYINSFLLLFLLLSFSYKNIAQNNNDYVIRKDSSYVMGNVSSIYGKIKLTHKSLKDPLLFDYKELLAFKDKDVMYELLNDFTVRHRISGADKVSFYFDIAYAKVITSGPVSLYEFEYGVKFKKGKWVAMDADGYTLNSGSTQYMKMPISNEAGWIMLDTKMNGPLKVKLYLLKRAANATITVVPDRDKEELCTELLSEYFRDFEGLAYGLKKGNYTYEQLEEIIRMYNLWVKENANTLKQPSTDLQQHSDY